MADALITADRHTSTNLLQLGTLVILADILYNAGHGLLSLKVAKVLFCLPFRGFKQLHGAFWNALLDLRPRSVWPKA